MTDIIYLRDYGDDDLSEVVNSDPTLDGKWHHLSLDISGLSTRTFIDGIETAFPDLIRTKFLTEPKIIGPDGLFVFDLDDLSEEGITAEATIKTSTTSVLISHWSPGWLSEWGPDFLD